MAARNATKATKATTQATAEKAQAKPAGEQQNAAALPPAVLPENFGDLSRAALDVLAERERQVTDKGHTAEYDDAYGSYELTRAAGCYAMHAGGIPRHRSMMYWPFEPSAFKPKGYRADLIKAAALLLAEIERIDRAAGAE